MNQFSQINHSTLLDMLAHYTTEYTQMLADNNKSDEFYKYKRLIEQLTAELEFRMGSSSSDNSAGVSSKKEQ